ncbi:MFS transporter [Alistipes finegoldii]|uniref:MFS transporter n=1 Tax=Alistipes finegoldii TaxID=214856 RepID=UPI003AB4EDF0
MMTKNGLYRTRTAISAFYFTAGLIFASWATRIPDIKQQLGLSDGDLGTVLFAIPAGQLTMMALSGYLVTRFGSRITLMLSTTAYAIILMLIPFSYNFGTLFIALFLFGTAANMVNIALNTQACALEGIYGRNIMSSFHGLWSLGGLFGGIAGVLFVRLGCSIPVHYAGVILICFCLVAIGGRHLIAGESRTQSKSEIGGISFSKLDRGIILLGLIGFGGMFCEGTLFDWSGVYFATVVRPDESLVRAGYIAGMGAMTLGRFFADGLVTRYQASTVLKLSGLSITSGLLLAVLFPHLLAATLGFLLVGVGISSIVPICYSMAGRQKNIPASIAITVVSSVSFIGFMIGPPLIGLLSEVSNLRIALGAASLFGLFVVLLSGGVNRRVAQHKFVNQTITK